MRHNGHSVSCGFYNTMKVESLVVELLDKNINDSSAAFYQVMERYQPDVLIVWGKRLWQKLPYDNWHEDDAVSIDGYDIDNGRYILSNGHSVKALSVYHPSVGYSWDYWHEVFRRLNVI